MAALLNSSSILMCPHGRNVQPTTSEHPREGGPRFPFPHVGYIPDQRLPVRARTRASSVRARAMGSTGRAKQGGGPFHVDGSRRGYMRGGRHGPAGNAHGLLHPTACFRPMKHI
jgi:hypothetical protein